MYEELKKVLEISDRIRERILKECRITRATFCNWINGKTPIPWWAKEKIDVILYEETGKSVFMDYELENQDCQVIA